MTPPTANAASEMPSGAPRPSGTSASPQPATMPIMVGHSGQYRR
jgi:hypothetical protein